MKKILLVALSLMVSVTAFANGSSGSSGSPGSTGTTNSGGNGGNGGAGGAGGLGGAGGTGGTGVGVGVGIGVGGSVANSGNSRNTNSNANSNRNQNTNVVASSNQNANSNRNTNSAQQGQKQAQHQSQTSTSNGGLSNSDAAVSGSGNNGSQSTNIGGNTYREPASTAYSGNIAPTAPCMGGTTAGLQVPNFGVSLGSTWKDQDCNLRENVRTVSQVLNDPATAAEMMCANADYAAARKREGRECTAVSVNQSATAQSAPQQLAQSATSKGDYSDPIIRARLGLPPLKN